METVSDLGVVSEKRDTGGWIKSWIPVVFRENGSMTWGSV